MPYTWLLADSSGGEHEGDKGAEYLLSNPAYPDNYIAAILDAQKKYIESENLRRLHDRQYTVCEIHEKRVEKNFGINAHGRRTYNARKDPQ